MKYLLFILVLPISLFSKVYFAKVEPKENLILKSAVSAQVTYAHKTLEGKKVQDDIIVELDSQLDSLKITSLQESLNYIDSMIATNQEIVTALQESVQRQESYYYRVSNLQTGSQTKKDNAYYSYINSKTQYLSTKEKIDSLEKQKVDINYEIARLQDSIGKKSIAVHNKFVYKILVNIGDFVNMGTPLVELRDLSSAKLILFLEADELKDIRKKKIYIDDKKTNYTIDKIWSVTDTKYISSYRTEIIIKPHNNFSKLLKVEFK